MPDFVITRNQVSRFLLTFSLAFDGSVTGIFWTWLQGGQLVIPSETAHRDPTELAALIEHHHISHVVWVPSLYHAVLGDALNGQLEFTSHRHYRRRKPSP